MSDAPTRRYNYTLLCLRHPYHSAAAALLSSTIGTPVIPGTADLQYEGGNPALLRSAPPCKTHFLKRPSRTSSGQVRIIDRFFAVVSLLGSFLHIIIGRCGLKIFGQRFHSLPQPRDLSDVSLGLTRESCAAFDPHLWLLVASCRTFRS